MSGRDTHVSVATKDEFCRDKIMFLATINTCSSRQNCSLDKHTFCRDKIRVCRDKIMFVATNKIFSLQNVCHDKHTFVAKKTCFDANKDVFCREKYVFVATKIILVAVPATDRATRLSVYGYMMNTHSDRQRVQLRNAVTVRTADGTSSLVVCQKGFYPKVVVFWQTGKTLG